MVGEQPQTLLWNRICCYIVSTGFVRILAGAKECSPRQHWSVHRLGVSALGKELEHEFPVLGTRTWLCRSEPCRVSWP